MIEKLKEHDVIDPKTDEVIGKMGCDLREIMDKLNEVIDAVNELQKDYDNVCIWVGEQKLNYNPDTTKGLSTLVEEPANPYAEQRQWIGKLCRFWDEDRKDAFCDVLGDIKKDSKYPYLNGYCHGEYKHCEPVKPDDDIIYKGE